MTLSITFYNNVKYSKDDFMNRDRDFFGNGVVQAGDFGLELQSGLQFEIGRGVAWVDGYRIANESGPVMLEVEPGGAEPRYDIVQVGHDDVRSRGVLMVKKGVPASEPIEPGADPGYLKLYSIRVGAGAAELALSDLHDRRERVPLKVSGTQIEFEGAASKGANDYTGVQTAPGFVATSETEPLRLPVRTELPAAVAYAGTMLVVNGEWHVSDGIAWSPMAAPFAHAGSGGAAHATATTSEAGFLSAADKAKLDSIPSRFYKQSAAPNGTAGDQWFDTSTNRWKYHNGTVWIDPLKYQ